MEGRGDFAYFDIVNQTYTSWHRPIGNYDWSPDGELIVYDDQNYIINGNEQIYIQPRLGNSADVFSALGEDLLALNPLFSPDGGFVLYRQSQKADNPEDRKFQLVIQAVGGGLSRTLTDAQDFNMAIWSADGSRIIAQLGPYDNARLVEISTEDGSLQPLTEGWQVAVQPLS